MSSYFNGDHTSKPHTPKPKSKVKPILKNLKFTQSEKNSLDLDRPIAEQDGLGIYDYSVGYGSRPSHDTTYNMGAGGTRRGYHARSTSGTSEFSTGTTGSGHGHRTGSFVHPFQQTPRPYTPPLGAHASYQTSLRESEHTNESPALTEDEDQLRHTFLRSTTNLSNHGNSMSGSGSGTSTTNPILQQPLRVQTKFPTTSSRLALAASHTSLALSPDSGTPNETMSPASPSIRQSLDKSNFRIRSRSEGIDAQPLPGRVSEARKRFEQREQEKEEKAAREEIRAMEKKQQKEAKQIEKSHRRSSASERPSNRNKRSRSDLTMREKGDDVFGRNYNSVPLQTPPFIVEEHSQHEQPRREQPRRNHTTMSTTKKKTHSAWTKLMMWLRTRFIRLKGRSKGKTDRT